MERGGVKSNHRLYVNFNSRTEEYFAILYSNPIPDAYSDSSPSCYVHCKLPIL